jgi:hypothetical protein
MPTSFLFYSKKIRKSDSAQCFLIDIQPLVSNNVVTLMDVLDRSDICDPRIEYDMYDKVSMTM